MGDGFESFDQEINSIGIYWACAKAFRFTPEEVDNIESTVLQGMLILEKVKSDKERDEIKRVSRK